MHVHWYMQAGIITLISRTQHLYLPVSNCSNLRKRTLKAVKINEKQLSDWLSGQYTHVGVILL